MAQNQISGAEVLIPPLKRFALKALILSKPHARYIAPVAQAVGNRIGSVFATLSWANRQNYVLPEAQLKQLIDALKSEANEALRAVGVNTAFEVTQTEGNPLTVETTVSKGSMVVTFPYTFDPTEHDFSASWAEMQSIAKTRWERFVKSLTDSDIMAILGLAAYGYQSFLTGDSAAEQKAKIKHMLAMERVKSMPAWYKQRLDPQKYEAGYAEGTAKYKEFTQNIAWPAILYGFEYTKAVLQVL